MSDVGKVGLNTNLPALIPKAANHAEVVKAEEKLPESKDEVTLGDKIQDTLNSGIGTVAGVGLGTVYGVAGLVRGSVQAGLKGIDLESKPKGLGQHLQKFAVKYAGPVVGAALGAAGGPVGLLAGAAMGPGIMGSLIKTGKGVVKGAKQGFEAAEKLSDKWFTKDGILKTGTKLAGALVASPVMALVGGIRGGFDFAGKAMGMKENPDTFKDKASNVLKLGAGGASFAYGAAVGLAEAGGIGAFVTGTTTLGGVATGYSGVKEAGKSFGEGFKIAKDWTMDQLKGDK